MKFNCYFDTYDKKDCNGCKICSLKCPKNAIEMVEDEEGFYYPKIDEKKCINCGLCKKICSNFNNNSSDEQVAYIAINNNKEELKNSASGGIFFTLARYVINNNGVVFGVEYDEKLNVKHGFATTIEECRKFQGSKYVRSDIGAAYADIEKFLKKDRLVLFTGTPCQCQGLKKYLNKDYDNLIICDIICHANPSQKVFNKYINSLGKKYKSKVENIQFRSKENGWRNSTPIIKLRDGNIIEDDLFYKAFSQELIDRPSCHNCKFSGINRVTDFTIGDFWGVEKILPKKDEYDNGVSVFLVNSKKAKKIFLDISKNINFREINLEDAFKYNHNSNLPMHKNRKRFFKNIDKKDICENIEECLKKPIYKRIIKKLLNK